MSGLHGDGSLFPIQLSLSSCNFQGQTLVSALAVDHPGAEDLNRQDLLVQLEQVNKELSDFANIISHDLKAPLRGIKTVLQWLRNDCGETLNEQGNEYLDIIDGRIDRMRSLVLGVLNYSCIGRQCEELVCIDLHESSGVGLTLVKKIVELYGGSVWVESERGLGSTFFFTMLKDLRPAFETQASVCNVE